MHDRYEFAKSLSRKAGTMAMDFQQQCRNGQLPIDSKGIQDFVTQADKSVEDLIRDEIAASFKNDGFFGEESSPVKGNNGYVWVVDPIDGTSNFIRGFDQWCISIACVFEGVRVIGCIYDPVRDILYHAMQQQGAFENDKRMRVNSTEMVHGAVVVLGLSRRAGVAKYLKVIEYLYDNEIDHRKAGSAAMGLAQVANGQADGYFESDLNAWDCMAGFLIIEEAGGLVLVGSDMSKTLRNSNVAVSIPALAHHLNKMSQM